jgi:hypothetical protein
MATREVVYSSVGNYGSRGLGGHAMLWNEVPADAC